MTDQEMVNQLLHGFQQMALQFQNVASLLSGQQSTIPAVQVPPAYDNLLEVLIAAGLKRGGTAVMKKNTMVVGPGMTMTMMDVVPPNTVMATVGLHHMYLDSPHGNVLLTHDTDGSLLFSNLPLIGNPITVQASFHPPARSYIAHTIVNNSALTVTFIDEMQVINIDETLWDTQIVPAIERTFNLNLEFGKLTTGGR